MTEAEILEQLFEIVGSMSESMVTHTELDGLASKDSEMSKNMATKSDLVALKESIKEVNFDVDNVWKLVERQSEKIDTLSQNVEKQSTQYIQKRDLLKVASP